MSKLEGKVAVITGGNSGIGLATAQRFVAEGAYVFITGRRQSELDAAVKQIGKSVTAVQGDISNLDDLDRLFATVQAEKGHVDVLFANAGIGCQRQRNPVYRAKGAPVDAGRRLHYTHGIDYRFHGNARLQRVQRNKGGYPKFCSKLGAGPEGYRHPGQRALAGGYNDTRSSQWTGEDGNARSSSCRSCQSGTT